MTMFPRSAVIGNTSWCLSATDLESVVRRALLRARRAPRRAAKRAAPLLTVYFSSPFPPGADGVYRRAARVERRRP